MKWFRRLLCLFGRRTRFIADYMEKGNPVTLGEITGMQFQREKGGVWIDVLENGKPYHWWMETAKIGVVRIKCGADGGWIFCEIT